MFCRMFHLHTTFLEQPLHKLPVGLRDDGGRQIRQFGLPEVLPQAAGLLHVFLEIKQSLLVRSEQTRVLQKWREVFIAHTHARRSREERL